MPSPVLPADGVPADPILSFWKRVALSYWTVAVLGAALLGLHAWWFAACRALPRGEVVSGFGSWLIVLGLLVAARPYIRAGLRGMAKAQVQAPQFTPLLDPHGRIIREANEAYDRKVDAAMPDILAERVIAVGVIVIGTLVNGYGGWISRLLAAALAFGECP